MYVFADSRKSLKRLGLLIANPLSATYAEGFANVTDYLNYLRLAELICGPPIFVRLLKLTTSLPHPYVHIR